MPPVGFNEPTTTRNRLDHIRAYADSMGRAPIADDDTRVIVADLVNVIGLLCDEMADLDRVVTQICNAHP